MEKITNKSTSKKINKSYQKIIRWATQDDATIKIPFDGQGNEGIIVTYQKAITGKGKKLEQEAILVSRYREENGYILYSPRWMHTPAGLKHFFDIIAIPMSLVSQFISALVKVSGTMQAEPIPKIEASLKPDQYKSPPQKTIDDEIDELLRGMRRI